MSKKKCFFFFFTTQTFYISPRRFHDISKIISKTAIELDHSKSLCSDHNVELFIIPFFQSDLEKLLEEKIIISKGNLTSLGKAILLMENYLIRLTLSMKNKLLYIILVTNHEMNERKEKLLE